MARSSEGAWIDNPGRFTVEGAPLPVELVEEPYPGIDPA
jgi:hypothetical protein